MSRIKKCIMGFLFLAIVIVGIYFYQDSSNEVQAETQAVNEDMLNLKFQVGKGTAQGKIRVVASVDSPNYSAVGFDIAKDNNKPQELTIDTKKYPLPQRIKTSVEGMEYSFSPKVVDTSSEYFLTGKWTADPNVKYTVCAWVKTFEGDKICGQSRCITLNDLTTTEYLNMSFELNEGCTLSKTEDAYTDITVTYNDTPTTAKVISVNGSSVHVNVQNVDRTALPSATKFVFENSDGTECGSTIFRNLYTFYSETTVGEITTNTADTSWYDVYLEENKDEKEFVIATSADLYGMATNVTPFAGKTIYLCADIEANKGTATADRWDKTLVEGGTDYIWPTKIQTFDGIFDGQDHTISGINAVQDYRAALFQIVGSNGVIQNLKLLNSYMSGKEYNASIAGRLDGTIRNVVSDAIVHGSGSTNGGLVGFTYASTTKTALIENCVFSGSVDSPNNFVGGIVGARCLGNLKIVDCEVTGSVSSEKNYAGGILGGLHDLNATDKTTNANTVGEIDIENCKFQGELTGSGECLGGIVGALYNRKETITIKDSTVGGTLTGGYNFGGVIGYTGTGTTNISGCAVIGIIEASNDGAGGIIGVASGSNTSINDCEFTGRITSPQEYVGGIVGRTAPGFTKIENSCFNGMLNVVYDGGGIVGTAGGKTEIVNCTSSATSSITNTGSGEVWSNTGGCVGRIQAEVSIVDSDFSSTLNSTYRTGGLVGWVRTGSATINNSSFNGKLTATTNVGGIIGRVRRNADSEKSPEVVITNSYTEGTLSATGHYAGGLVGYLADGTVDIKGSFSSMNFDQATSNHKGGLLGYVYKETDSMNVSLTDCLNCGTVKGASGVGGLAGSFYVGTDGKGTLKMTRCLNTGDVIGTSRVGTVVGWSWSSFTTESVYAVLTNNVTTIYGVSAVTATTCELNDITISSTVTVDDIKSKLSGLFTEDNTIWTIGTTEGSTPKLNLTTQ